MNKRLEKVSRLTDQARDDKNFEKVLQGEYIKYQIREKENEQFTKHLNKCRQATN